MTTDKSRRSLPIVVIGAGFAGMSAALTLAEKGKGVCLLEAGKLPGGRARSFHEPRSGLELDWGPHLFMRANTALRNFLERIGAASSLPFADSLGLTFRIRNDPQVERTRQVRLEFPRWGGQIGGATALLRWNGPTIRGRFEILMGFRKILAEGENSGGGNETVAQLLSRIGQKASAQNWFWEPFARAVLNLPLEAASGILFRRVLQEAFGAGPGGAALGSPDLPMRPFWGERGLTAIRQLGGEVRMKTPVRRIQIENGLVRGVILSDGTLLEADSVISAIPPTSLAGLLPEEIFSSEPWRNIRRIIPSPIASAYLWLDRSSKGPLFEALVNESWHWLFRPGNQHKSPEAPHVLLVGGTDSIAAAPRVEIETSAIETSTRILPGFQVNRAVIIREKAATWANGAIEQAWRPLPKTTIRGLFLAGDWTATGLPATCEGAVRSGQHAAEILMDSELN